MTNAAGRTVLPPVVSPPARWRSTRAFGRGVLFVALMLALAIFAGRPDMAVLAAPVAMAMAIGLRRRPSGKPSITIEPGTTSLVEGGRLEAGIRIGNGEDMRYDLVVIRIGADQWLRLDNAGRPYATAVAEGQSIEIELTGQAQRWGRHHLGPVRAHAVAADGLLISPMAEATGHDIGVYPITTSFHASDAVPRAAGMIGSHRSRRPGDGGELAGVRKFGPGDRLRRIDWRVSLRTRELHVSSTLSDRDAEVVILLDVMHEAGQPGGIDGPASALDTTVRAAAAIADYYLHLGDRVAFIEYGFHGRRLRGSSGHRHYVTALEWLLDVRPARGGMEPPPAIVNGHHISPNALVIVLTPLLDPRVTATLAKFARSGKFVVAVDTMPPGSLRAMDDPASPSVGSAGSAGSADDASWLWRGEFTAVAARLWRFERTNLIGQLREHGVPVVSWGGAGSLDEVLRQVSRTASSPRIRA